MQRVHFVRQCRAWGAGFSEEEGKVTPRRAFQSSDIKLLISIATNNHPRKGQKDRQAQVSFVCVCVCVCVCIPYIYEGMREQGKRGEGRQHSVWLRFICFLSVFLISPPSAH